MRATPDGGLETSVTDDAEPERRRRSFEAIEERVKQLHGTIRVDAADGGTRVVATLPPYATRR
jgi:signal transduction histidine kinase